MTRIPKISKAAAEILLQKNSGCFVSASAELHKNVQIFKLFV